MVQPEPGPIATAQDVQELAGQQAQEIVNLKLLVLVLTRQIRELQAAAPNRAERRRQAKEG